MRSARPRCYTRGSERGPLAAVAVLIRSPSRDVTPPGLRAASPDGHTLDGCNLSLDEGREMRELLRYLPSRVVAVVALSVLPLSPRLAHATTGWGPDACAGAGSAANAVVRFYLAVDRRQFAAAYRCLPPAMQAALPYSVFVAGYAHTVSNRLVLADDEGPNGAPVDHVFIELHAVDRRGSKLIATTYMGQWTANASGHLTHALVHVVSQRTVPAVPPTNVVRIFADHGRVVLEHLQADVTGDGVADDIYVTSGAGCGSCHAQQAWVYSLGRLVFQQLVDDAEIRPARDQAGMEVRTDTPGSPGLDSCCPTERTYEEWAWTPYGFTLRHQRVVHVR